MNRYHDNSPEFAAGCLVLLVALTVGSLLGSGCATTQPWESAEPGCLELANASCQAAMLAGRPAGVIACTLPGTQVRHAVTWVETESGLRYYDPSFGRYRTRAGLGKIWSITTGPSKGCFDLCPMPQEKK